MAEAIFNYFKWNTSKPYFFLIDTFLPYDATNNSKQKKSNKIPFCYASNFNEINKYFSKYKNVKTIQGSCPNILKTIPKNKKIIFAHVDLNNEAAEIKTLKYFVKKNLLKKGSVIIFDDYGANRNLVKGLRIYLKKIKKDTNFTYWSRNYFFLNFKYFQLLSFLLTVVIFVGHLILKAGSLYLTPFSFFGSYL